MEGREVTRIKLEPAFAWNCPVCGERNFVDGVIAELNQDEQAELRWKHGIDEMETGDWLCQPTSVGCVTCEAEFPVQGMIEDAEDD